MCDTVCVLDRGRSDAKVGVRELFASPATLAAALISGCKNVSRARVAGPGLLMCDDWGVTLETSLPVSEGVTHVGHTRALLPGACGRRRRCERRWRECDSLHR
jgi:molybdate transport system ATP-binding protein